MPFRFLTRRDFRPQNVECLSVGADHCLDRVFVIKQSSSRLGTEGRFTASQQCKPGSRRVDEPVIRVNGNSIDCTLRSR